MSSTPVREVAGDFYDAFNIAPNHVWFNVEVLIAKPLAGSSAAGLDFVEDQQQLLLVAQLAKCSQESGRRWSHAPFSRERRAN